MKRLIVVCLSILLTYPVLAFDIQYGKNITITSPVYENLYIAGGNVIINAPVHGDLIIAGGTIAINDTVMNDILVAGGNVTFNGYAGGDVRCAGGKLNIIKDIAGDLLIAGGTIIVGEAAMVNSVIAKGGEVIINGITNGTIRSTAGSFALNGTAMKAIHCEGNSITINGVVQGPAVLTARDKIKIGDKASFKSTVRYWTPERWISFNQSVQQGKAVYDPQIRTNYGRWYFLGFTSFIVLLWYMGMAMLLIMIVQYLFSRTMKNAAATAHTTMFKSMAYGLLFWIGIPVMAGLAFITVIGVPIGVILLFNYILLAIIATIITSVVIANWFSSQYKPGWSYWYIVVCALGVFIFLKALTFSPFLGWLIMFILSCIAFGAILLNVNWRRRNVPA